MTDREAFERMLEIDRYDLQTRLVFSDWLEEHDCPEEADFQRRWTAEWQQAEDALKEMCLQSAIRFSAFVADALRLADKGMDEIADIFLPDAYQMDLPSIHKHLQVYLRRLIDPPARDRSSDGYDGCSCGWEETEDEYGGCSC